MPESATTALATPETVDAPSLLTGWGNTGVPARELRGEDLVALTERAVLTRGLARSYGDSSLPPPGVTEVAGTALADRILEFDPESGRMRAEAGLSIHEINRLFLHRGFFMPVTPGTQFVTLGGMVASDVHGKNHHVAGTFGRHVDALKMRVPSAGVVECSREQHEELFRATIGGMGLTGHILEVAFGLEKIPSPWILQESFRVKDIDAYVDGLKESAADWPMTMGWIDCLSRGGSLGRGILMRGRWATPAEAPAEAPAPKKRLTMPPIFPSWTINDFTVAVFNFLYFWKHQPARKSGIVHPESFQDGGPQGEGLLSFPMPGISIAIDFAIRDDTPELVATLNEFVIREGGRVYLTKDTFTTPEHFAAMEPRLEEFQRIRRQWDPDLQIRSAQSVRMLGDAPFDAPPRPPEAR